MFTYYNFYQYIELFVNIRMNTNTEILLQITNCTFTEFIRNDKYVQI